MNSDAKRIAIIGGGITGLAAAHRIHEQLPTARITLYESSARVGGVIQSTKQDGFLFEHSADNFIVSEELPWAGQLCEKLGLPLIPTAERNRGAWILRDVTFYPVPEGMQLGTPVVVLPDEYGSGNVSGALAASGLDEIAVRRQTERAGEVVVHFPREDYSVVATG